jgi:hypothetical protein
VPEAVFYGTRGTFDTQTFTARGVGGGSDALPGPITIPPNTPAPAPVAAGGAQNALAAAQNDPRVQSDDHVLNWLECLRTRATPTAPVEVGYAHTVASIMCFEALKKGCRQVFDAETKAIRAG